MKEVKLIFCLNISIPELGRISEGKKRGGG
jgi:hypothetical protein